MNPRHFLVNFFKKRAHLTVYLHTIYRFEMERSQSMDFTDKQFSRLSKRSLQYLEKLQQKYTEEFGDFITKAELMSIIVRYSREQLNNPD